MIKSLEIKNFRGIKSLKLKDLAHFNIIVGSNGVGKTSILEAIHLAGNGNNPAHIQSVAFHRGQVTSFGQITNDLFLRSLFFEMKAKSHFSVSLTKHGKNFPYKLVVKHNYNAASLMQIDGSNQPVPILSDEQNISVLDFTYSHPKGSTRDQTTHNSKLVSGPNNKFEVQADALCGHCISSVFYPMRSGISLNDLADQISKLRRERKISSLIEILKTVEPRLEDIEPSTDGGVASPYVSLKGVDTLLPAHILGDGFLRVLQISVSCIGNSTNMINFDEVDAGLHHSVMSELWKSLIKAQSAAKFQIFCTTHNEEMIRKALEVFKEHPNKLSVYRIDRSDKEISSKHRTYEAMTDLVKGGHEFR